MAKAHGMDKAKTRTKLFGRTVNKTTVGDRWEQSYPVYSIYRRDLKLCQIIFLLIIKYKGAGSMDNYNQKQMI